jgi:hypothetical protein
MMRRLLVDDDDWRLLVGETLDERRARSRAAGRTRTGLEMVSCAPPTGGVKVIGMAAHLARLPPQTSPSGPGGIGAMIAGPREATAVQE